MSSTSADRIESDRRFSLCSSQPASRRRSSGQTALAVTQMTTCRSTFDEDVIGLQRQGLRRIGVWRRKLEEFGVERAAEVLCDHGVTVSSLSWGGGFTGSCGFSFDEAVDDTRTAILQAAALGAHSVTLISGGRAGHIHSHYRRLLLDGLAATVDIAAEHGVTIALQPLMPLYAERWTFLDSLEETLDVVAGFNHSYLGIAFGSYHLWREARLADLCRAAVPFLATVQLADWKPTRCDCDRLLPGQGAIPLAKIVEALSEAGYRGDYEVDVWSSDLWKCDASLIFDQSVNAAAGLKGLVVGSAIEHGA